MASSLIASSVGRRAAASTSRCSGRVSRRWASTSAEASSSTASSLAGKWSGRIRTVAAVTSIATTCYFFGAFYPPTLATYVSPRTAPPPPEVDSPSYIAYTSQLEDQLQKLPPLQEHRARPDADEWYETRPYLNLPEERAKNSLTAGSLRGPGKLVLAPLIRCRKDRTESLNFVHVGTQLCGHEGIVHGGLLATLLDESLGRMALLNLPERLGVTAYLNLNYKAPTRADQFLVIKTHLVESKGRKSKVAGRIEDMQGNVLVEAEALFIQPKYAKLLNKQQMKGLLGEPEESKEPITEGAVAPVPVQLPSPTTVTAKA